MESRGHGATAENQHLARRAALMTRAHKRDVDKEALRGLWAKQALELGLDAKALVASAVEWVLQGPEKEGAREAGRDAPPGAERQANLTGHPSRADPAKEAVEWALAHLSERDAVFARTDLLAAALAYGPGSASIGAIERVVEGLTREGRVHDAPALKGGGGLTTEVAVARERETIALMRAGSGRGKAAIRGWMVDRHLRKGPLTAGQKRAVKLILSEKDRTVGVQGYAGVGKTRMLDRARTLAAEEGLARRGARPLGVRGAHAGGGIGDRERDPAAVPGAERRAGPGPAHEKGRPNDARRLREDRAGGRRGVAGVHRPGPRPAPDRGRPAHTEARARRRRQTTEKPSTPASPSPNSRPRV